MRIVSSSTLFRLTDHVCRVQRVIERRRILKQKQEKEARAPNMLRHIALKDIRNRRGEEKAPEEEPQGKSESEDEEDSSKPTLLNP